MLNNHITALNISYEDRLNSDSLTVFPSKFNTTSNISSDMDCISIWGPVSNLNCPKEYPDCNCPNALIELRPADPEPSISELERARNQSQECYFIRREFGVKNGFKSEEYVKWGGIDYSNKDSTYNCMGSKEYGRFQWQDSLFEIGQPGPLQTTKDLSLKEGLGSSIGGGYFPYAIRKTFSTDDSENSAWDVKDTNSVLDNIEDKSAANQAIYPTLIGSNFPYYLEYSKTNATFWNTPEHTPLYRKAQVALLRYLRIKILVNGDFTVKPGSLVYISRPTDNRNADVLRSRLDGYWMVYKAERIIKPGKHSMYLYLMRDYPTVDPNRTSKIFLDKKDK